MRSAVNARTTLALAWLLAGLAAGCGEPKPAHFSDGAITQQLYPDAARLVRAEVEDKFGTPTELVASLVFSDEHNLPIDFGRIKGEVIDVTTSQELKDYQFVVRFEGDRDLTSEEVEGLGLVFASGAFQQAVYESPRNDSRTGVKKGDELPAYFQVIGYQPVANAQNTGIVSVNFKLSQPPQAGDAVQVVGHRLRNGRRLYRRYCMHCHGYSGDGNGPTAKYLNPRPRDYRLGLFKFTSTAPGAKASRNDLKRTVRLGIPGTYMPSFLMQPDDEIDDIVEYVRWLSLRGEYERYASLGFVVNDEGIQFTKDEWKNIDKPEEALANYVGATGGSDGLPSPFRSYLDGTTTVLVRNWSRAETGDVVVRPKQGRPTRQKDAHAFVESVRRGRALFLSSKTNCWTCHGKGGEGNGPQTTSYQQNKVDPLAGGAEYPEPGLYDNWGNRITPRNLTKGVYRGGRRPIDLYRRIKVGIKGTPMPSFGALSDREIWDLVNYVMSIPHQENGTFSLSMER